MGYTHYWYVAPEFDGKRFAKVAADFKTMVAPLRHLGVILADGLGANQPTIAPTKIMFNGLEKCGHEERELGITWPAKKASGIIKNGVGTKIQEITKSKWFAGAELETRSCGGDCSHETFKLEQKYDNIVERFDGSTYTIDPVDYTGRYFACCKTAYKPYDLAVTVCLVIAKHRLGDGIAVSSDGEMANWEEAMQLCQHFLNYGLDFKLGGGE